MSTHQGTTIKEAFAMVEEWERRNNVLCATCQQPRGIHAYFGSFCPNPDWRDPQRYLTTTFAQASPTCIASIGTNATGEEGFDCGKPAVGDTEFCEKHLGESGI